MRRIRPDIVLEGCQVKPDVGQVQLLQSGLHGVQFRLLGSQQVADHELHLRVTQDQIPQSRDLAAGTAQLADVDDEHKAVLFGKSGFPLHHVTIQRKHRAVGHQAGAGAHLKFDHPDAQFLKEMVHNGVPVPAVRVVSGGRQKAVRILLLCFAAVLVLEAQIAALQQNGTFHFVGIHHLQHPFRGYLIGVPLFRDDLTDRTVRILAAPAADGAHLAARTGAGNALHQMDMSINDLHAVPPRSIPRPRR